MSYFLSDAENEVRTWLKEFLIEIDSEDRIVFTSGLSDQFHKKLEFYLANKIWDWQEQFQDYE